MALAFLGLAKSSGPPVLGSTATRSCTFAECGRGGCDAALSPFLCVDPKTAFMGCSALGWDAAYCADSCTMADCAFALPDEAQKSCKGVRCSDDRCDPDMRYQRCGDEDPYQVCWRRWSRAWCGFVEWLVVFLAAMPDADFRSSGVLVQCTAGSSAMGCSADPYGWILAAETTCSGCCDSSAC